MKKIGIAAGIVVAAVALGMGRTPAAAENKTVPERGGFVFVAGSKTVDPELVRHCAAWADENSALKVSVGTPVQLTGTNLESVARDAVARKLHEGASGLIIFYWPEDGWTPHGVGLMDHPVVAINVRAMKEGDPAPEIFTQRCERQGLRAIGRILGLETSPNPQSVMAPYGNLAELDMIGRNFDPPWLIKLQEKARDAGVTFSTNRTFFALP
jgi:hypothetical protein